MLKDKKYEIGMGTFIVHREFSGTKRPVEIVEEKIIATMLAEKEFAHCSHL